MSKLFSKEKLPLLAIAFACIIWGAGSPIFKWSLTNIPTFTLAFLRFFLAALLLFPFVYKKITIEKSDFLKFVIVALFGININIIFFFKGLEKTSALSTSIIIALEPIFILLASLIFLKEKFNKNILLGILISFIGFIIIIIKTILNEDKSSSLLGDLFIIIAVISYAIQTIYTKKLSIKYPAETITFWSFLIGSFLFLPFLISDALQPNWLKGLTYQGIIGIVYGALGSSAIAYFLYNWGIKYAVVSKTAVLNYLNTISGVIFALLLLQEKLTLSFIFGSLLIFVGVYITEKKHDTSKVDIA